MVAVSGLEMRRHDPASGRYALGRQQLQQFVSAHRESRGSNTQKDW